MGLTTRAVPTIFPLTQAHCQHHNRAILAAFRRADKLTNLLPFGIIWYGNHAARAHSAFSVERRPSPRRCPALAYFRTALQRDGQGLPSGKIGVRDVAR